LHRYYSVGITAINDGQYDYQMGAYPIDAHEGRASLKAGFEFF
jgi:hypothetical protein